MEDWSAVTRTQAPTTLREAGAGPAVLHVLQSGNRGGVQRHVRDLALGLTDLTAGTAVGGRGWLSQQLQANGIRVLEIPALQRSLRPDLTLRAGREIVGGVHSLRATLVHAHGVIALAACLAAQGLPPLVYTPHGFQWRDPAHSFTIRVASRAIHRAAIRRVATLVAVSQQDAADAATLGFRRSQVVRIPNGVPSVARGTTPDKPFAIGVASRLVPGKGIDTLLEVVAALPHTRLMVAGDGPDAARLQQACARLGISDRVSLLGWQDSLDGFYRALSVYASMSLKEGLPYAVLDALAYGVPVLLSDIPAHRELISQPEQGVLVSPADVRLAVVGLQQLLARTASSENRGCPPLAPDLMLETMVARHRELYQNVARGTGSAQAP